MEDLEESREVFVRQMTRCFRNNRYNVETSLGKHILTIQEDTNYVWHYICCSARPFQMYIKDLKGEILYAIFRPFKLRNCCFPCCSNQELWIADGDGRDLGTIEQKCSFPKPHFLVKNDRGVVRLTIEAPCCPYTVAFSKRDVHFKAYVTPDLTIGLISKVWNGCGNECLMNVDLFRVIFPLGADVRAKGVLMAIPILLDLMYYESRYFSVFAAVLFIALIVVLIVLYLVLWNQ